MVFVETEESINKSIVFTLEKNCPDSKSSELYFLKKEQKEMHILCWFEVLSETFLIKIFNEEIRISGNYYIILCY